MDKIFTLRRKNDKLKVLFDMDDVIADFMAHIIPILNKLYEKCYTVEDIKDWNLKSYYGDSVNNIFKTDGLFFDLEPKNDALKEFPKIYNNPKLDVWIVTACMSIPGYIEKLAWMDKFFPDFPMDRILPCKEKDTIWGDIIIDDGLHNLKVFELIGEPIVYDMPHNRIDIDNNPVTYKRVSSMREVRAYLNHKIRNFNSPEKIAI